MKDEYLKTYKWMNSLKGGVLRDVYALLHQLGQRGEAKVTIAYICERLGYQTRQVQRAISELKETGMLEVQYKDGESSVFKTQGGVKSDTPVKNDTPVKSDTTPMSKMTPPTPYISSDKNIDYSTSTEHARMCARERLTEWYNGSTLPEWTKLQFTRNGLPAIDTKTLLDEFYDNDFKVRERCEQGERMEVLSHFQNWLPKYISKIKQSNGNNSNQTSNQRVTNLEDIAQSILAGCQAGRASRQ